MSVVETAAILSDVGVADKKMLSTFQKHLKVKLNGNDIFCTRRDLNTLTCHVPRLHCSTSSFQKEFGLKKELIGVACIDTIEGIQLDMDRFIQSKYISQNIFDPTLSTIPLFKTKTPTHADGTYVIIGTDHGQGTAQFLMRLLLGDSAMRRLHNRPDFNTRNINYATIKCKKDPYKILKLTKDETNTFLNYLRNHKLIALTDNSNQVRCIYVSVKCTYYSVQGNIFVASGQGVEERYHIPDSLVGTIKYRVLINSFYILQVGDLLAQMSLQGREGMASCRCIKCNLTKNEWQSGYTHTLISKKDLNHTVPNVNIGQRRPMLWDICPMDTVIPILHCELGTVNDQLYKKLFRQILCLDVGTDEELKKRLLELDLKDALSQLEETKSNLDTDLVMTKYHLAERRLHLTRKKKNVGNRLKNAKRKFRDTATNATIQSLESVLLTIAVDIKGIDTELLAKKRDVESLDKQIISDSKLLEKAQSDVKDLLWNKSIHTKIERILESHGVTIQCYHGGSLTGGSILTLLKKHDVIMDDITEVCHEYLLNNNHTTAESKISVTVEEMEKILNDHRLLFKAQDAVYAHLRLIDPTEEEMIQTVERIKIMKMFWLAMGLSETPKAHLVFEHAADDQRRFGGLGDKIEDPLEKRHQEQMRLDGIKKKMPGGFRKRMLTQQKYDWRNSDPLVRDQIELVRTITRRKRKQSLNQRSIADQRSHVLTTERHRIRDANVNDVKQMLL